MMTLTRVSETPEYPAMVQMTDGRNHSVTLKVYDDGSRSVVDGAAWMVNKVRGTALKYALHEAVKDGRATVEAR